MSKSIALMIGLSLIMSQAGMASSISGEIKLDKSWQPIIYLSLINSFDDLNAMSYDFLIAQSAIDSSGRFEFIDIELPETDRIYRLHICKQGDPVSTIIIGGKDENFIHFVMNNSSHILIKGDTVPSGLKPLKIRGHTANKSLIALFSLEKGLHHQPSIPSRQSRIISTSNIRKAYLGIADTTSSSLVRLLAIHLVNELYESPDIALMENTLTRLTVKDSSDPYYNAFINQLDYLKYSEAASTYPKSWWINWAGAISLVILLVMAFWMRTRKKGKPETAEPHLLSALTIQEKKVFELLKSGASNKEISSQLNIEVSTVKSHVHKVFSRLGVKSRKEIANREW